MFIQIWSAVVLAIAILVALLATRQNIKTQMMFEMAQDQEGANRAAWMVRLGWVLLSVTSLALGFAVMRIVLELAK